MKNKEDEIFLYICPTPIGNLKDITLRTLETLKLVDMIACEDTRVTQKLLNHYEISKKLVSYHEHSKKSVEDFLVSEMEAGKKIALVSDAGMPGINDPGADLIRRCQAEKIEYSVLPGPTAFATGLIISGLDNKKFSFEGFFPRENKDKKKAIESLKEETRTTIFYETPHRIDKTMKSLCEEMPDRNCAIVREISKVYEELIKGSIKEIKEILDDRTLKGEIVLIIEGTTESKVFSEEDIDAYFQDLIAAGTSKKDAIKEISKNTGINKNKLYNRFMIK